MVFEHPFFSRMQNSPKINNASIKSSQFDCWSRKAENFNVYTSLVSTQKRGKQVIFEKKKILKMTDKWDEILRDKTPFR